MRLIVAVFVLGENMEVHGKDILKLCLGLWWEVFWKERFVWNVDFVEILKNKVLKILVRYWLFFGLSIKRRVLTVPFVEIQGGVALFVE